MLNVDVCEPEICFINAFHISLISLVNLQQHMVNSAKQSVKFRKQNCLIIWSDEISQPGHRDTMSGPGDVKTLFTSSKAGNLLHLLSLGP